MMKLALLDIGDIKIRNLSYSQRRRLSFARERLKDLKLIIFQEPILNLDRDGARIILENIEELRTKGVAILNLSVSFKDTILLGGRCYILDDSGMNEMYQHNETDTDADADADETEEKPMYKIEKITAKIDERILLFNPIEIDYIESEQGTSNLNVRGEKFTCVLSLNELENRLKYFGFFRCHRSYLVNLQRVREIVTWTRNSYSLILDDKNKSSIPLSKGRMDELKDILKL
jgi:ABC-2 type transport system ATP-binding protein